LIAVIFVYLFYLINKLATVQKEDKKNDMNLQLPEIMFLFC